MRGECSIVRARVGVQWHDEGKRTCEFHLLHRVVIHDYSLDHRGVNAMSCVLPFVSDTYPL